MLESVRDDSLKFGGAEVKRSQKKKKKEKKCMFMLTFVLSSPSRVPGCFHGNSNFVLLKYFMQKRFHFGYLF